MLDFVGTRFRDGTMEGVERLGLFAGSDIATTLDVERWRVKVGGRDELLRSRYASRARSAARATHGSSSPGTQTRSTRRDRTVR